MLAILTVAVLLGTRVSAVAHDDSGAALHCSRMADRSGCDPSGKIADVPDEVALLTISTKLVQGSLSRRLTHLSTNHNAKASERLPKGSSKMPLSNALQLEHVSSIDGGHIISDDMWNDKFPYLVVFKTLLGTLLGGNHDGILEITEETIKEKGGIDACVEILIQQALDLRVTTQQLLSPLDSIVDAHGEQVLLFHGVSLPPDCFPLKIKLDVLVAFCSATMAGSDGALHIC